MQIRIEHQSDSSLHGSRVFGTGTIRIGRAEDSDLRFDPHRDLKVSTRHAEIRVDVGGVTYVDLGSTNGSHVNGTPVEGPTHLKDGDTIQLGHSGPRFQIFFETPAPAAAPATEAAPPPAPPAGGATELWAPGQANQAPPPPPPGQGQFATPPPPQASPMPPAGAGAPPLPPPGGMMPPPGAPPGAGGPITCNKDRTLIDLPLAQPLPPLLQRWATEHRFKQKSANPLSTLYSRGGFWTAPIRVDVAQRSRSVHIEAWVAINLFVRICSLFLLPKEMGIHSGGFRAAMPRKQARKAVNALLRDLNGPPIP